MAARILSNPRDFLNRENRWQGWNYLLVNYWNHC